MASNLKRDSKGRTVPPLHFQSDASYDRMRMTNPSGWLDFTEKATQTYYANFRGIPPDRVLWGGAAPRLPAPPRRQSYFNISEVGMTSGTMLTRTYAKEPYVVEPLNASRTCPMHFPNYLRTKERDAYTKAAEYQGLATEMGCPNKPDWVRASIPPETPKKDYSGSPLFLDDRRVRVGPQEARRLNVDLSSTSFPRAYSSPAVARARPGWTPGRSPDRWAWAARPADARAQSSPASPASPAPGSRSCSRSDVSSPSRP